jgi:hypothetical protein
MSPLRGYTLERSMYPRLTPWATEMPPLRGFDDGQSVSPARQRREPKESY